MYIWQNRQFLHKIIQTQLPDLSIHISSYSMKAAGRTTDSDHDLVWLLLTSCRLAPALSELQSSSFWNQFRLTQADLARFLNVGRALVWVIGPKPGRVLPRRPAFLPPSPAFPSPAAPWRKSVFVRRMRTRGFWGYAKSKCFPRDLF